MIGFLIVFVVGSISYVYPDAPMYVRLIGAALVGGGVAGAWHKYDRLVERVKRLEEKVKRAKSEGEKDG